MATPETRQKPNILVTGSPGTGKSTLAAILAEKLGFDQIECSKEIREHGLYEEYDERMQTHVFDEDKLLDHIEERMDSESGGVVVDFHGCDFFPQRWFDIVVVLRCDNTKLYDRMVARGYPPEKIRENVQCEIFNSIGEEARESYDEEIVFEVYSETVEQMNENADKVVDLFSQWMQNRQ
ncbi:hypothetical protein PENTCL1PPCAC_8880 [Pristionchus entomophagus]|uniref:Adenylate kinase isoenzyme 6 homolog n=1 Tax=Pristionchus entomophagus TaxID=358040 RepID=A0AAV5SUF0_9BILA|nr:hypothetical protein PENTCL1PPCAC_8880 [Pristionchus entomophagus]